MLHPLAIFSLAAAALAAEPAPPPLTYLYSVNLTFAAPVSIGEVPYGTRDLLTISGGTVSGPKINGTFAPSIPISLVTKTTVADGWDSAQARSAPASTGA